MRRIVAVAPRAGAWIETYDEPFYIFKGVVAPRAGAWIETNLNREAPTLFMSLPARERGLKHC